MDFKGYTINTTGVLVEFPTRSGGGGSGTVTDFVFTDGSGFDGTVTNSTTTPTLSIGLQSNFNFVTDAEKVVIGNTSGTNTGDQVISDATITTTDITTNNATTVKHGFLQKLPGGTSTFLRADGAFAAPTASVAISQAEIDFGTTPLSEQVFTITDGAASATSKIICTLAYDAPTDKDLDELDMDNIILKAGNAAIGSFSLYVTTADGSYLADKFKINYLIAS